jgi:hypothetical protein
MRLFQIQSKYCPLFNTELAEKSNPTQKVPYRETSALSHPLAVWYSEAMQWPIALEGAVCKQTERRSLRHSVQFNEFGWIGYYRLLTNRRIQVMPKQPSVIKTMALPLSGTGLPVGGSEGGGIWLPKM